jgi:hypothetical protein
MEAVVSSTRQRREELEQLSIRHTLWRLDDMSQNDIVETRQRMPRWSWLTSKKQEGRDQLLQRTSLQEEQRRGVRPHQPLHRPPVPAHETGSVMCQHAHHTRIETCSGEPADSVEADYSVGIFQKPSGCAGAGGAGTFVITRLYLLHLPHLPTDSRSGSR